MYSELNLQNFAITNFQISTCFQNQSCRSPSPAQNEHHNHCFRAPQPSETISDARERLGVGTVDRDHNWAAPPPSGRRRPPRSTLAHALPRVPFRVSQAARQHPFPLWPLLPSLARRGRHRDDAPHGTVAARAPLWPHRLHRVA